MTEHFVAVLVPAAIIAPLLSAALLQFARKDETAHLVNKTCAVMTGMLGLAAAAAMLAPHSQHIRWAVTDPVAGVYVGIVTVISAMSALLSPAYLRNNEGHFFSSTRSVRSYYLALYLFWAALITIPIVANLGVAWVVVEATTGASAVLVAFSGKPRALEASWKYLMLTTLGLSLAFLGIVIICLAGAPHGAGLAELNWSTLPHTLSRMPHRAAVVAYALVMLGLAAKIGWAPLQNWLPDAHSEAPAPISAMLSSVLLPAVILLAWRLRDAAIQPLGHTTANAPLVVFGILSVAVAVPFLWQPMPWKRLMAYHTLEHMGIITVGIAIASPLAIAGVLIHVAGHALAKALGFYATIPLFQIQPDAARQPAHNVAKDSPATFAAMAVTAVTLAGLPPTPLFFSELFIILGGIQSRQFLLAGTLAVLVALAFIGLLHALLEALQSPKHQTEPPLPVLVGVKNRRAGTAPILIPTLVTVIGLAALAMCAGPLVGSEIVRRLVFGIT